MQSRVIPIFGLLVLAALLTQTSSLNADNHADGGATASTPDGGATPDAARRARVVLTVGTHGITVGELEDRIAAIPVYQLTEFGGSHDAVAHAYLDQVLIRDAVLAEGAKVRGLDRQLPTKQLLERAFSGMTLRSHRMAWASASSVPMDDVRKYYQDNLTRFDSPERINLWRILCKSREDAMSVLESARHELTLAKYNDLAREHSIDKATYLRGGNLGFVAPDGASNEAGVKVDPALVKAAQGVKDGELVTQPIAEGMAFAVVWRRATVPPAHRSVEDATAQIRSALYRERSEADEKKLIAELRARDVHDVDEGLLGIIELRPFDAGVNLARSPASPLAPSSARPPAP